MWLIERFGIQYCTTIRFTQENVWRRSREFAVTASNSQRKWAVRATSDATRKANAEYVPMYRQPQLFRWRGYWVEIKRTGNGPNGGGHPVPYALAVRASGHYVGNGGSSISITVYTLDMNVLSDLVEEARLRYLEVNRPNVVIYLTDSPQFGPHQTWSTVKHKIRRPLKYDAQEFLGTENCVDDSYLQRAASAIPKHALFLIEDIDCAFPSRDEDEEEDEPNLMTMMGGGGPGPPSPAWHRSVTLSGLLNVIDGIGSEEGKLFFATVHEPHRPSGRRAPAPGRIDHKVQYGLATAPQALALFMRFFPVARFPDDVPVSGSSAPGDEKRVTVRELADAFAAGVPPGEFSTAEIQGYLQGYKRHPADAARGVGAWVEAVREERRESERRKEEAGEGAAAECRGALWVESTVVSAVNGVKAEEVSMNGTHAGEEVKSVNGVNGTE
ncbi:hypothetical protein B0H13DRAFT_2045346 [Mycena leptocephala]|nr:hypothetical protein B0H13DRAFT_2045346 [Mycena leptocephala]